MLRDALDQMRFVAEACTALDGKLQAASDLLVDTLAAGGKVLTCGNGGSAAEAQHFVTELVGRYKSNRRSLPSIWLGGDTGQMTCIANDFSPEEVFSRPLDAFATPDDLLIVLSTSGQSPSILRCLERAAVLGVQSVALLGKGGGMAAPLATIPIIVPSASTARVQEMHLLMVHVLCDAVERRFSQ